MKLLNLIRKHSTAFAALTIVISLAALCYPFVSNYVFEHRTDSLISTYEEETAEIDTSELDELWGKADEYNNTLVTGHIQLTDPFEAADFAGLSEDYEKLLNTSETGIMAYISIPKISVYLPIYHGTDNETLEKGVGHLEGSSLPIGGESTHAVLSAHTGLNRARLFTDLTELEAGDFFFIHVLGETLAYEVDQILVVEPSDISALQIENGQDYITLVTCTPYGVNTHRLFVRGTRTEYTPETVEKEQAMTKETQKSTSQWMREYTHALIAGLGIVLAFAVVIILAEKVRKDCERH
jgi:sortase A